MPLLFTPLIFNIDQLEHSLQFITIQFCKCRKDSTQDFKECDLKALITLLFLHLAFSYQNLHSHMRINVLKFQLCFFNRQSNNNRMKRGLKKATCCCLEVIRDLLSFHFCYPELAKPTGTYNQVYIFKNPNIWNTYRSHPLLKYSSIPCQPECKWWCDMLAKLIFLVSS